MDGKQSSKIILGIVYDRGNININKEVIPDCSGR